MGPWEGTELCTRTCSRHSSKLWHIPQQSLASLKLQANGPCSAAPNSVTHVAGRGRLGSSGRPGSCIHTWACCAHAVPAPTAKAWHQEGGALRQARHSGSCCRCSCTQQFRQMWKRIHVSKSGAYVLEAGLSGKDLTHSDTAFPPV